MDENELLETIARGEGQTTEFKQSFAESQEAIESLCAFLHAQGGCVIFGVRDDGTIVGAQVGRQTIEGFANKCYRSVVPPLTPDIGEFVLDGKRVAVATIKRCSDGVIAYVSGVAYVRVGKTNQIMPPEELRRRYHVDFVAANQGQRPTGRSPANASWHEREAHRVEVYRRQRGLFLGHSWQPSSEPGQVADIVIFLRQHDSGRECDDKPLADGRVKSVEYHLGGKFFQHTVVVGRDIADFRLSISAYGPVLCLAQVNFDDGAPPIMLERYIDF